MSQTIYGYCIVKASSSFIIIQAMGNNEADLKCSYHLPLVTLSGICSKVNHANYWWLLKLQSLSRQKKTCNDLRGSIAVWHWYTYYLHQDQSELKKEYTVSYGEVNIWFSYLYLSLQFIAPNTLQCDNGVV